MYVDLRKPTFRDASSGFPANWLLSNGRRNYVLMTHHFLDLGSVSDCLKQVSLAVRPIVSTTHFWEEIRHQYGILRRGNQLGVVCGLFPQDIRTCRRIFVVSRHWSALCTVSIGLRSTIVRQWHLQETNFIYFTCLHEPDLQRWLISFFSAPQQTLYGVSISPQ